MSEQEELDYWTSVRKKLKAGTKAWYDATKKIQSAQQAVNEAAAKVGNFDVANDLLSSYTDFYDISEKATEEYWDKVRQQYAVGTEDRLKADKKYYDAHKSYLEKIDKINEDYAKKIEDKNAEYTDALKERAQSIADAFGIFDKFESESESGQELLFNMQAQAAGYQEWSGQLSALSGRGILSEELLDALSEKGPTESAALHALNSLSDDELRAYQTAYDQRMAAAQAQATKDTEATRRTIEAEIAGLKAQQQTELAAVNTSLTSTNATLAEMAGNIRTITQAAANGFANGVANGATGGANPGGEQTQPQMPAEPAADPILAIIGSGKSRSKKLSKKEKSKHHKLREYIAANYGRTATTEMYKKLAGALGVSVGKTVSSAEEDKILKELKKRKYATGSRYINRDQLALVDELGSEMIVRAAGRHTYLETGDGVVPANLTKNLFEWGTFRPADLNRLVSASVLNASLGRGMQSNNAHTEALLERAVELLGDLGDKQIVLSDGRAVGEWAAGGVSNRLARNSRRIRR